MKIQDFIKQTFKIEHGYCFRPVIKCNDGFTMSVQGSSGHYCKPRKTQDFYESLEIGFPNEKEDLILQYAEKEDFPTETVYGWVPIEVIQQVIDKHGGIDVDKTFAESSI